MIMFCILFIHKIVPRFGDPLQTFVNEFLLYIIEIHGEAVQGGYLSDTAAHSPCTYHKKGLHNHLLFGVTPLLNYPVSITQGCRMR